MTEQETKLIVARVTLWEVSGALLLSIEMTDGSGYHWDMTGERNDDGWAGTGYFDLCDAFTWLDKPDYPTARKMTPQPYNGDLMSEHDVLDAACGGPVPHLIAAATSSDLVLYPDRMSTLGLDYLGLERQLFAAPTSAAGSREWLQLQVRRLQDDWQRRAEHGFETDEWGVPDEAWRSAEQQALEIGTRQREAAKVEVVELVKRLADDLPARSKEEAE